MRAKHVMAMTLAAGLVLGASAPGAARERRNGRISFTRLNYTKSEFGSYSIRPDGSGVQPIRADGKVARSAAYSPNGRRIAVAVLSEGRHLLQIIDLHGNVRGTLASFRSSIGAITWSPHGSKLAFGIDGTLSVIRRDGRGLRRLPVTRISYPRWSPDGSWILATRDHRPTPDDLGSDVVRIRPSGADLHVVIRDAIYGTWSPAGHRIAFYRFMDGGTGELFTIRADGTHERRITFTEKWNEGAPAWSPDGRWIAYSRWRPGEIIGDLMKINLATRERMRLTNTPKLDEWVPIDWQAR